MQWFDIFNTWSSNKLYLKTFRFIRYTKHLQNRYSGPIVCKCPESEIPGIGNRSQVILIIRQATRPLLKNCLVHSLIHSFSKYIFNAYSVPATMMGLKEKKKSLSSY